MAPSPALPDPPAPEDPDDNIPDDPTDDPLDDPTDDLLDDPTDDPLDDPDDDLLDDPTSAEDILNDAEDLLDEIDMEDAIYGPDDPDLDDSLDDTDDLLYELDDSLDAELDDIDASLDEIDALLDETQDLLDDMELDAEIQKTQELLDSLDGALPPDTPEKPDTPEVAKAPSSEPLNDALTVAQAPLSGGRMPADDDMVKDQLVDKPGPQQPVTLLDGTGERRTESTEGFVPEALLKELDLPTCTSGGGIVGGADAECRASGKCSECWNRNVREMQVLQLPPLCAMFVPPLPD